MEPRIAVLMAAHNRVRLTLQSLKALQNQTTDAHLHVFLVDDGSVDGTASAAEQFLQTSVTVLRSSGNLYWSRSMALAEQKAVSMGDFEYLLWLNDDTFLFPWALSEMLALAKNTDDLAVVVGSVLDPTTGEALYGGLQVKGPGLLRQRLVKPSGRPQFVDTFHGNIVLIPRTVYQSVGSIDAAFEHGFADTDYGLRARHAGFPVVICPNSLAEGTPNLSSMYRAQERLEPLKYWRSIMMRKNMPPRSLYRLLRKHSGASWPLYFVYAYLRAFLRPWWK